jgi:hypothetical protein
MQICKVSICFDLIDKALSKRTGKYSRLFSTSYKIIGKLLLIARQFKLG